LSVREPDQFPGVARRRLEVRGRVQGVGFRPFVYRLAMESQLAGLVGNDTHGAFIEIEGPTERLEQFVRRLQAELPPLARIAELRAEPLRAVGEKAFRIDASERTGIQDAEITPDVATCDDCLYELLDPQDRRYRYPFINCTNCGPRYSIIQAVPYDRPNTTMARFTMCPSCQAEYDDPANRRFHAQPNACPVCGPRVWLTDRGGRELAGDAIRECARLLAEGGIVAIKGIGGFHLACRADDEGAVSRLRERKGREAKPLAIMMASLEAARHYVEIDACGATELDRPERPIVLLPKRAAAQIAPSVAPRVDAFGVMLPYTPVHTLLFAEGLGPLVMTSGNPTEEPLCCDNEEALRRLPTIADAFLLHDRDIQRRVDDSVVLAPAPGAGATASDSPLPIRRARGFAPAPIEVAAPTPQAVLAVGGELKSTICVLTGNQAILSEHLGELANAEAYRHFTATIEQFKALLRAEPAVVACDLHPDYAATRWARKLPMPVIGVQHHHAHVVSAMADNGITGLVVGVSCDGTGYGPDGAIWGCEVLVCDEAEYERAAHLGYYPLPGGDAGARETWRPAAGLLSQMQAQDWDRMAASEFGAISEEALHVARRRLREPHRLPQTSSLGRLFDAAAFLLGLSSENRFEADAAMNLEAVARLCCGAPPLLARPTDVFQGEWPIVMDARPVIGALLSEKRQGRSAPELARAFHETVATMLAEAAARAAGERGLDRVVLSGGCLANRLLAGSLRRLLQEKGLSAFVHRQVPAGDGGLALGQAVVAAERVRRHGMRRA